MSLRKINKQEMNKIYRTIFLCLIWIYGYGAEPSSVLPPEDFSATFVQDSKDLLPPKNSDRYLEINNFKLIIWVKKNRFGKNADELKQYSADLKLGTDRFELDIYNNRYKNKEKLEALVWARGKFEFVKQKNTEVDEVVYECTNNGTTVNIKFSYLLNRVSSISMMIVEGGNYIGLIK
jgi:hypothetical protein